MVQEAISYVVVAASSALEMFLQLLEATETTQLWIAGVCFVFFVSIILMPFRGGNPIGSGGFVGFLTNKVNSHKRTGRKPSHED